MILIIEIKPYGVIQLTLIILRNCSILFNPKWVYQSIVVIAPRTDFRKRNILKEDELSCYLFVKRKNYSRIL